MSTIETVRRLLSDAAERSAIIDSVMEDEGARFEIALTDDRTILAEFDPASLRLMLAVEIGRPVADRRSELLELLMSFNALWRETGGARIASGGRDEPFLLMIDVFVLAFDAGRIAELIDTLAARATAWGVLVTASGPQGFAPGSTDELSIRI